MAQLVRLSSCVLDISMRALAGPTPTFIPLAQDIGCCVAPAEPKGEAERQCYSAHRCHEEDVDQVARNADLIDRDHDCEGPNRNPSDVGQQFGISDIALSRRAAHKTGKRVRRKPSYDQNDESDYYVG